ncbi:hypothetical protein [Candidatus Neptunochlamydia vexilliferae]|uniref:Uncharacterized protein n=1 Tax=Candidatus Neptunichlamydia vexilliferae TaxID=1651774 RepID=A0ABS0AWU0_9BACT|nr:hypothetical protein [Candidatus Neptunochlamydia vexilliferae]MBF5058606.1 hypothetical protein [Candidatus Neptunochlamydia vexilliferae]
MSIYPTSKSSSYQSNKKDAQYPSDENTKNIIQATERFFKQELPDIKKDTKDWVMEKLLPAMTQAEKAKKAVSDKEVNLFLQSLSKEIPCMIKELETISFSRGHELDNYTYPSVEKFQPIASWLKALGKKYDLYKGQKGFISKLQKVFQPFIDTLTTLIREQALASRKLQYKEILSKPTLENFIFNEAVTKAHINALNGEPQQVFLELRDLLNLQRNPEINRVPSMQEQKAFQFLLAIAEFKGF